MRNYLFKHWRGEQPLWQCFGLNTLLPTAIVIGIVLFTPWVTALSSLGLNLRTKLLLTVFIFPLTWLVIFAWQAVGVARATAKAKGFVDSTVGLVACFVTTLFGINFGEAILNTYEKFPEIALHTFGNPYGESSINQSGHMLSLDGAMSLDTTKAIQHSLNDHPEINLLQLNSIGGYLTEATALADLIAERNLEVWVTDQCLSSCVLVLARGTKRCAQADAEIGFHAIRNSFIANLETANKTVWQPIKQAGYPAVAYARSVESEAIVRVPTNELIEAGFLHNCHFQQAKENANGRQ